MKFVAFHGSPGSPRDFELVSKELPQGSLIAPARAGYERWFSSEKKPLEGPHVILGYSWGCFEAIRYAESLAAPRAVVLISAYLFSERNTLKRGLVSLPGIGSKLIAKAAPSAVEGFLLKSCDPDPVPSAYREAARELANPEVLRLSVLEKKDSAKTALDALARLSSRSIPIGVIHGAQDRSGSLVEQIAPIRERVSLAFEEIIPESGHALVWTRSKQIAEILRSRFL